MPSSHFSLASTASFRRFSFSHFWPYFKKNDPHSSHCRPASPFSGRLILRSGCGLWLYIWGDAGNEVLISGAQRNISRIYKLRISIKLKALKYGAT